MYKNDGARTNEEVFWKHFEEIYGEKCLKDKEVFDKFYTTEFKKTKVCCGSNPVAREIIDYIKNCGLKIILATNPVFPIAGMITRLEFIGLKEEDFNYITGYENTTYCKCNPKYYEEILSKNNLKADEVVFFGNSEKDDYRNATDVGIKSYLVGDDIKWVDEKNEVTHLELDQIIPTIKNFK